MGNRFAKKDDRSFFYLIWRCEIKR